MNARKVMRDYGLRRLAKVSLIGEDEFKIEITNLELGNMEKCIYCFVIGNKIIRIGSSKDLLRKRMRSFELSVTKALKGLKAQTPEWEARGWKERLKKSGKGEVWARRGTEIETPVGKFPAYLDEESFLLGKHRPPLNRNFHR